MEPQRRKLKKQNVSTRNQIFSRLRKMHRKRISRLKPIIFPQRREDKKINLRFKHLKPQCGMSLERSGVAWACRAENNYSWNAESQASWLFEGLKGFSVKDFENLWYSWNVNRFVQISIRDLLTVSHLQLDGKWRVCNPFCNERREWESTGIYIYIYIY